MRLGFIGVGVVGGAMLRAFSERQFSCAVYDKFKAGHDSELDFAQVAQCPVVFISVPTPTDMESGMQDQLPLLETCLRLQSAGFQGVGVVKCTVLPGTTEMLAKMYGLRLVHSPEFLTAARPYEDFMSQPAVHLGGDGLDTVEVAKVFHAFNPELSVMLYTRAAKTELIKYMHNNFLAVKVAFCNEIHRVCDNLGVDYDEVREGAIQMGGIGPGHTRVPGPDGRLGFGGMCFPKDSLAFLHFVMHTLDFDVPVLAGAVEGNIALRPELYKVRSVN